MNLKANKDESKHTTQRRHASVLQSLYYLLEQKTDDIGNTRMSVAEHHIYLGILQNIHTFNNLHLSLESDKTKTKTKTKTK